VGHDRREFSLASARDASARGEIALWVGDFLASRGSDNEVLAAALAQHRHAWHGPVRLELERLVRIAGPEHDVPVPIERDVWEDDVEEMEGSLEDGWEPPPLLVQYLDGELILQDGTHRAEALARNGETDAWALVYFPDEPTRDAFVKELPTGTSEEPVR
jgi:hypothetical protein